MQSSLLGHFEQIQKAEMADKNESSYVQRALKRTREMARIKAGKAS